jgi:hypothetical protein
MSSWYFIIALVAIAVVGSLLLRYRSQGSSKSQDERHDRPRPQHDYAKAREDSRLSHMSTDDRAWEKSSLRRHQATQERRAASAE